jgi:hypothetical protein
VRLSRLQEIVVYALAAGTLASGMVWLWFEHFIRVDAEFGPVHHALQPWIMKLHGALALVAVWGFGMLWPLHIKRGWVQRHSQRSTGATLFAVMAWLGISGVLLYYTGNDRLREIVSVGHWIVGLVGAIALLLHRRGAESEGPLP